MCFGEYQSVAATLDHGVAAAAPDQTVVPAFVFDEAMLLVNDDALLVTRLFPKVEPATAATACRVAIIVDNAGAELLSDLVLVDFLLQRARVPQVAWWWW
jgi:hypothetical protein